MSIAAVETILLGASFLIIIVFLIGLVFFGTDFTKTLDQLGLQLSNSITAATDSFRSLVDFIVQGMTQFGTYLVSSFETFAGRALDGFTTVYEFLRQQLGSIIESLTRNIINVGATLTRTLFQSVFNVASAAFTLREQMNEVYAACVTKLSSLITQGIAIFFTVISETITTALGYFGALITSIVGAIGTGINFAIELVEAGVDAVENAFFSLVADFQSAYTTISSLITTAIAAVPQILCDIVINLNIAIFTICKPLPGISCDFVRNGPGLSPTFTAACCTAGLPSPPSCCTPGAPFCGTN